MSPQLSNGRCALLLMDLMPQVVPAFGGNDALLERLQQAADAARRAGITVIYVRVMFRDGYPDVDPANRLFANVIDSLDFTESGDATAVHPGVPAQPGDLHVTKRRVSAFAGSDLEVVLRSLGIDTLVLAGVATSGVVLSTLREAADRDYRLVLLSDGCADRDPDTHRVLVEKVFPSQAYVTPVSEWIAAL